MFLCNHAEDFKNLLRLLIKSSASFPKKTTVIFISVFYFSV